MNVYKINYSFAAKNGQMRNGALLLPGNTPEEVHIKATQTLIDEGLLYPAITNITLYTREQAVEDTKKKK